MKPPDYWLLKVNMTGDLGKEGNHLISWFLKAIWINGNESYLIFWFLKANMNGERTG